MIYLHSTAWHHGINLACAGKGFVTCIDVSPIQRGAIPLPGAVAMVWPVSA